MGTRGRDPGAHSPQRPAWVRCPALCCCWCRIDRRLGPTLPRIRSSSERCCCCCCYCCCCCCHYSRPLLPPVAAPVGFHRRRHRHRRRRPEGFFGCSPMTTIQTAAGTRRGTPRCRSDGRQSSRTFARNNRRASRGRRCPPSTRRRQLPCRRRQQQLPPRRPHIARRRRRRPTETLRCRCRCRCRCHPPRRRGPDTAWRSGTTTARPGGLSVCLRRARTRPARTWRASRSRREARVAPAWSVRSRGCSPGGFRPGTPSCPQGHLRCPQWSRTRRCSAEGPPAFERETARGLARWGRLRLWWWWWW
mmetsp:Transcript_17925/g.49645  ORF Transcript_17925/g.49645 Transcript_17925/m.49645 type:complete len:305 (-) Transcript_17925:524-1438(-)